MGGLLDFLSNIFWILALGGLGACAYLGTSLIAESCRFSDRDASAPHGLVSQSSSPHVVTTNVAEIDLTDVNLLGTKIIVGILFAFTVGLPVYTTQGKTYSCASGDSNML